MLTWIEQDEKMLSLLKDKEVALVGPAPYLIGQQRGKEFDSCDLIARPNEIIPLPKLRPDYGNRTDIFFCNFGTSWMPGIKRKIQLNDNSDHFKQIKMVVGSAIKAKHSDNNFLSWPNDYVSDIPSNFQDINEYELPFYWLGVKNYKSIYEKIGVEFNTGIAAITILLNYPIKKLKVSGFTFYLNGSSYEEIYCEGHMDSIDTEGKSYGISHGHGLSVNLRQIEYFRILYQSCGDMIEIDDHMKNILSL